MKNKKIVLTFDYELFLFESGNIYNCIIQPVLRILKKLEECDIKAVFFIDSLFIYKLKKLNLNDDFKAIKENIHHILKNGHQVELHLHTHWADAIYDFKNEIWNLSNQSKYRFFDLSESDQNKYFDLAYSTLKKICKEYDTAYKISCFRAGGLCIQPFEIFIKFFKKYKIKYECSVAPNMKSDSKPHKYNFENYLNKDPYFFKTDPIKKTHSGQFIECPINYYEINFFEKLLGRVAYVKKKNTSIFGNGKGISPIKTKKNKLNIFSSKKYFFSLDEPHNTSTLIKKIKANNEKVITILSHPKLMSERSIYTLSNLANEKSFSFDLYKNITP